MSTKMFFVFFRIDEYVFWCTKASVITFLGPDLPVIRLSNLLHKRILLHRWIQSADSLELSYSGLPVKLGNSI